MTVAHLRLAERAADSSATVLAVPAGQTTSGRIPTLWRLLVAICCLGGLLSIAVADEASRSGDSYTRASIPFWIGLLLIFVPLSYRAISAGVSRRERLVLVVAAGAAFYLVKVIASPDAFTLTDEFVHLRNTQDILRTHHLFTDNPLLPTAAYYPGLGALTAAMVASTGLSVFAAGLLVIGVARAVFSASLFLIAERITGSHRVAAAAVLVYTTNPMYLFWSAAFAYENLALPLAAVAVWCVGRTRRQHPKAAAAVGLTGVAAVTVTHHVVGFALASLLVGWWLVERILDEPEGRPGRAVVAMLAFVSCCMTVGWFILVARPAASYLLTNNLLPALRQTGALLVGDVTPRKLYTSGGLRAPAWETDAGFAGVLVLVISVAAALRRLWWSFPASMALAAIAAIAYPVSLVPRFAPTGVALSGRSSEYLFAGLGCVVGLLVTKSRWSLGTLRTTTSGRGRTAVATALGTIVLIGNVTIGTAFYQRLPEATRPKGVPWTVQPDVVTASRWAKEHLGIDNRFGADAVDSLALATYGGQDTVNGDRVWPVFFGKSFTSDVSNRIAKLELRYVLVDWRITRGVPPTPGYYFSPQEPGASLYRDAFAKSALAKFGNTQCTRLIYAAGEVQIFDVSRISSGSCREQVDE